MQGIKINCNQSVFSFSIPFLCTCYSVDAMWISMDAHVGSCGCMLMHVDALVAFEFMQFLKFVDCLEQRCEGTIKLCVAV